MHKYAVLYMVAAIYWCGVMALTAVVYIHSQSNWAFLLLVLLLITDFSSELKAQRAHDLKLARCKRE